MIINRIHETQNLLSLWLVSFLVGLRNYQHHCKGFETFIMAILYLFSLSRHTIITFRPYKLQERQINYDLLDQGVFKPLTGQFQTPH
jgi:hypothetical protein